MRPVLVLLAIGLACFGAWALWPRENKKAADPTVMVEAGSEPTGSARRLPVSGDPVASNGGSQASQGNTGVNGGRPIRREQTPGSNGAANDPLAPGSQVFTMDPPRQNAGGSNGGQSGGQSGGQNSGQNDPGSIGATSDGGAAGLVPTQPTPPPARPRTEAQAILAVAQRAMDENRLVDAREELNRALHAVDFSEAERDAFRTRLTELNETLFFSPTVTPGDPLVFSYTIKSGDVLINVVRRENAKVDWRFITRINRISDPSRIRPGQTLKMVRGPLHAVVNKSAFRLDLYADQKDGQGNRMYLRSFPVGLGEFDSTPVGQFVVRQNSKLVDPRWVNPRTGEAFASKDPKNPIGNRWIGLEGTDANTSTLNGYGIHGTIDPQSIGKMASMGCVRMQTPDVELIYEVLIERVSEVEVRP